MKNERTRAERGSGLPLVALSLGFVVVMVLMLTMITGRALDRAKAQAAADAAALAGVVDGEAGASSYASENGAILVEFSEVGTSVVVTVKLEGVRAVAKADRRLELDPSR